MFLQNIGRCRVTKNMTVCQYIQYKPEDDFGLGKLRFVTLYQLDVFVPHLTIG